MSARNLPEGKGRPARKADLTAIGEPTVLENVGASSSQTPMGLHGLLQGYLYLKRIEGAVSVMNTFLAMFRYFDNIINCEDFEIMSSFSAL
jgi:hypothetical protein